MVRKWMVDSVRCIGYGLLAIGMGLLCGCTHPFDNHQNTPLENFEALWKIIDEKYCYLEEKGVNWDSIYTVYRPLFDTLEVVEYKDQLVVFDLMEQMINELEDGHVNLYSSFDVSYCSSWYEGYPENFNADLINNKYLKEYRQAGGLAYSKIDGDSIGYVYYGSFSNGFSLSNALSVFNDFIKCRGIVLDVRNNGGGSVENAYKLASLFFTQDTVVGYWQHKSGPGREEFSDLEKMRLDNTRGYWQRPVIVLCNRHSYSATNFFVSIMRYAPNCLILGGKSGGGGGMPLSYELPNGWIVRFSSVRMYDRDKVSIEGGVTPDKVVNMKSLQTDDIIDEAVRIINYAYDKK